jgi:hypothetical protein
MSDTQDNPDPKSLQQAAQPRSATVVTSRPNKWRPKWRHIIPLIIAAVGWMVVHRSFHPSQPRTAPAHFRGGLRDGILMPIALPWLLLGQDVSIYALENTGRPYKIGYTLGVNGCGAVFFGLLYRRFHRARTRSEGPRKTS